MAKRKQQQFDDRLVYGRDIWGKGSLTGLAENTVIEQIRSGEFPPPFFVTPGLRAWWLSAIVSHLDRKAVQAGSQPSRWPQPEDKTAA